MPATNIFRLPALVAVSLSLAACTQLTGPADSPKETQLPRPLSADEQALIHAGNSFAFDLIRQVPVEDPDAPNVFLSPLSASMTLGMAMNGASGDTWSQMRDALGFREMEEPAINQAYQDLIALLEDLDSRVEFGLANSVWARQGTPIHEDFLERTRTSFDAQVETLDFGDPLAAGRINDWVADRTNGRIPELIDRTSEAAIMYLINAVYFKGDWQYRFDPSDTRPRPFTRADGRTVQAPTMAIETDLRYTTDSQVSIVELPYGGGAFTAIVALPAQGQSIGDLMTGLDADTWSDWMDRVEAAEPRAASVLLPRFELSYDRVLNDDLEALGMVDAFRQGAADFTRLTPLAAAEAGEVFLSMVRQKSFVKVDERGTEAAAATVAEVVVVCAGCGRPTLAFDRPFLFAIRERLSNSILFIGVIGDPTL